MIPLYTLSKRIALLSLILISGYSSKAQWCTSNLYYYACYYGDYIQSVSTTGGTTNISNLNTYCGNLSTGYTYYSNQTVTAMVGSSFNYSITNTGAYNEYYGMWIDYNNNGSFTDAGEQIFSNSSTTGQNGVINGTVNIPSSATAGTKRMRIRCAYDYPGSPTPCGTYYYGEAEDYNVVLTPSCPAPSITAQPQNRTTCETSSTAFNVAASNASSYQWQVNTGSSWANVSGSVYSGATTSTLALNNIPLSYNNYQYRCVVTGACNNPVNSNAATMTVNPGASIISQTTSDTICDGASLVLNVTAGGTFSGYQWQMAVVTVGLFYDVPAVAPFSGINSSNLTINNVPDTLSGYLFRARVVGGLCPDVTSNPIPITVLTSPQVIKDPVNDTIYPYNDAGFNIAATPGASLVYYWQASADGVKYSNINNNSLYQNVLTPALTLKAPTPAMADWWFRCIIKSTDPACGVYHDTSNAAQLKMLFESSVNTMNTGDLKITIYPNPVSGAELFVQAGNQVEGMMHAIVIDKLGRTVIVKDVNLEKGKETVINVAQLTPGVYSLQLADKDGNIRNVTRFTRQ